jgi:hypothetical protein
VLFVTLIVHIFLVIPLFSPVATYPDYFIVEQMHRAAFVLPTFVKQELEAYCASTERVRF